MTDQEIVRFDGTGKMVRDEAGYFVQHSDYAKAQATISRLTEERDEAKRMHTELFGMYTSALAERDGLRKALEPFVTPFAWVTDDIPDQTMVAGYKHQITAGDVRAGRAALATPAVSDAEQGGER